MQNSKGISIEEMDEQINVLKERWLKKKISLFELTNKIEGLLFELRKQEDYHKLKKHIENIVILDQNIESSTSVIANTSMTFIPILFSINSVFWISKENNVVSIVFMVIMILMSIGLSCIVIPVLKKHSGNYAREKGFYEVLIRMM